MSKNVDLVKNLIFKIEKGYQLKTNLKAISALERKLAVAFQGILKEDSDEVFEKSFNSIKQSNSIKAYISCNLFPLDYKEYGSYQIIHKFTNNFRFEFRWLTFLLKYYSKEISAFVAAREEADNYILLNEYEKALQVVNAVEKTFGVSLWSGEYKCFLYTKLGLDFNEFFKTIPQTIIRGILNFFEIKNRDNITSDEFFYMASREIRAAKQDENNDIAVIEFFDYAVNGITYKGSHDCILRLFETMRMVSLIDQYLLYIDICDFALLSNTDDEIYVNVRQYIHNLSEIEDEHLTALRFVFDNKENRKNNYSLKYRLEEAKEDFIKGNIAEARKKAVQLLKAFPNNTEAINLLVDTCILLGKDCEEFEETNLGILIRKLKTVYTLGENRDDEIDETNKFLNCLSWSSWAKSIRNNIIYRCQECGAFKNNRHELLANLQYLDIETLAAGVSNSECAEYITEKLNLNNQYISFRKACSEENYNVASELCNIESIRNLLFVCDEKNSIIDKATHLEKVEGNKAAIAIMQLKQFISIVDFDEKLDLVLDVATDAIVNNVFASILLPMNKIIDCIDKAGKDVRKNICTPILYYVYAYYFRKEKMDDFYMVCEDFFLYEDIDKPTKMDICKYKKEWLVFFLKNVCNLKVMDMSIAEIGNTQERDRERVEVCNILCQMDSSHTKEYENEIRELTQRLMINKELATIEESKINVNIDGIKERLIKNYKHDFLRYKYYREEWLKEWAYLTNDKPIIFKEDTSERILNELLLHIRDAFVSSEEYGLDVYLSLNIRHGTLADELRGPLIKAMLTAKKDVETDTYEINPYWTYGMKDNDEDREIIINVISEFHVKTESIISKLKEKYIQISTEKKITEGLFNYVNCNYVMAHVIDNAGEFKTFEDFLECVFNCLWAITEANLEEVKKKIKTEIHADYNLAFEALKNRIASVKNRTKYRELNRKIAEAETDMPNVLGKICHWFQRSTESKHSDFDLQFAFDVGLQTVKNIHPEKEFIAVALEETISEKIPGYHLKDYEGIFCNLFDNIYEKCYSKDGRTIEIRYTLKYRNGKTYIHLENDYDCTKDMTDDIAKIEEQKAAIKSGDYKKRISGEGGTGIPKICNIIISDMKKQIMHIDYDFVIEKNVFFIKIEF